MRNFLILSIFLFAVSCTEENDLPDVQSNFRNGIFVVNEGNYTWSNASISYINLDSSYIENEIFLKRNKESLGDVAQSMYIIDSLLFIIVNNSAKIEVVDLYSFESIHTILGFSSPRFMLKIDDNQAVVSDLYSKYLKIINHQSFELIDSIFLGKSSENLLLHNNKLFITNWSKLGMSSIENNTVQVIDIDNFTLIDSIEVNYEPCGLQIDKEENLWVLCSGSFTNSDKPALMKINPLSMEVLQKFEFSTENSPKHLRINRSADTLYYLNNAVYAISIDEETLPITPNIDISNHNIYNYSISPFSGNFYITDVVDYVQNGFIYEYSQSGIPLDTFEVKINPSEMLFVNSY